MKKLVFTLVVFGSASAMALGQACPKDPAQIAANVSERFILQRILVRQSRALLTFKDDSGRSVSVYRNASHDLGVSYTLEDGQIVNPKKLPVRGAQYQVTSDISRSSVMREALELTLENYNISFSEPLDKNPDILIYKLSPKGELRGRFKPNAELLIDRTTCLPVRVLGEIFTMHIGLKIKLDILFGTVKEVIVPEDTDMLGSFFGYPYHMKVENSYSKQDIILNSEKPQILETRR